ncbi:N-acetylglucosamine-6-phosphate deacetylase [Paracoccaceae bacterium GXU_MW_L88]
MEQAVTARRIFDGTAWHENAALEIRAGRVYRICPVADLPKDTARTDMGAMLAPGFVDLQVNGGGGVMLGASPGVAEIETIIAAHQAGGTTALLPTLITDTPEVTRAVLEAGAAATRARMPGFLGLHLEGPHLDPARHGAHDPRRIRAMEDADLAMLIAARKELPALLVTVAPASVTPEQVAALVDARIRVSLGHAECGSETARAYADAGARSVTHLFNAMSPLGHRAPGLVGAALDDGRLSAGLIADGVHVDPAALRIALRAKAGPGGIYLVTDAMAVAGTDLSSFKVQGREIYRKAGRLTLADGTLAGADCDMISCVRYLHETGGARIEDALTAASTTPAKMMEFFPRKGALLPGSDADFVALSEDLTLTAVARAGEMLTN